MDNTAEETFIVIMLKDKETGFLDKELGCYALDDKYGLIDRKSVV